LSDRLSVRKTYKLYIGGAFPRSESGRTYQVDGDNVVLASRKDVRDAVGAARKAQRGWAGATAYNRGQVLYRVAEMIEARRAEFVALGVPESEVAAAIDRWVWYAGWSDKLAQVYGGANPVAGPYFNLSAPEPTGVVGMVAPPSFLGLVSVLAPAIVTGNTVVVLAAAPQVAVTLAEVLATSDVPGGVVNILTGRITETAPWLASHDDVNALDLTGVDDADLAAADPGLQSMTALLETKTVWHPKGF
jgi:acyl-CoA reductase-like NAD-dependent aldehyde dehydrogenase